MHSDRMRRKVWEYFYADKFSKNYLDALLSYSRVALFCVEDNEMNTAAKALDHLRSATAPSPELAFHFESSSQILSRFLLWVLKFTLKTSHP